MHLRRSHPQFWLTYLATAFFHIWTGALQVWGGEEYFSARSQIYVYEYITREAWGTASLVIGIGLIIGLFTDSFTLGRACLAAGAGAALVRLLFHVEALVKGDGGAMGVGGFVLIAVVQIAQTLEPTSNPAAASQR